MRYAEKMDRPLSDDDRRWLKSNNFGDVADQFDREDGVYDDLEERDYSNMTLKELKAEVDRRNKEILGDDPDATPISTDGNKADLVQRLRDDDVAVAGA